MFKSLKAKILFFVIIPLVFIFIVVALIALSSYESKTGEVLLKRDTEVARISAARLAEALNRQTWIIQEFIKEEEINTEFNQIQDYEEKFKRLNRRLFIFDELRLIINHEGKIVYSSSTKLNSAQVEVLFNSEYEKVKNSRRPVFSNIYQNKQFKDDGIFIGIPIYDPEGKFVGILGGVSTLKYSLVSAIFSKVLEFKAGESTFAFLVDGTGRIISHRHVENIGQDLSHLKPVELVLKKETGATLATDNLGNKIITAYAPVPNTDWGIITQEQWSVISKPIRGYNNLLLILFASGIIMVYFAIVVIVNQILNPIRELTKGAKELASGNFEYQIESKTKDELHTLADQFNKMALELNELYTDLENKVKQRTSELADANELLSEQKKELEKVNQELDRFVYIASHDLRAPLRGISSFSSFLEEDYKDKLDGESLHYLENIRLGVKRMEKLIEDLLTLSRISRIKNPFSKEDMNQLINEVVHRFDYQISEYNINFIIQPNLPDVICDRVKITEVFSNLIGNSIKFSAKDNNNQPEIEVGFDNQDNHYIFFIRDNGIGIDEKFHQKIFDAFSRLHSNKEYEGSGIGLNIVARVIDEHQGKLWIKSKLREGATFYFSISKNLKESPKQEEESDSE